MRDFRELKVWEKAHVISLSVYRITASFPKHELYGMISQTRRAAVSVAANLAEGCGKNSRAEFGRFIQIALGSASELEYHLLLARDLDYLAEADFSQTTEQVREVKRMLTGLMHHLSGLRTGTDG